MPPEHPAYLLDDAPYVVEAPTESHRVPNRVQAMRLAKSLSRVFQAVRMRREDGAVEIEFRGGRMTHFRAR